MSLARIPAEKRQTILSQLTDGELKLLQQEWSFWARGNQLPPPGSWHTWVILAGRGFGKTRCLVEWVCERVRTGKAKRIGIAGATAGDVREILVEGESGFLNAFNPALRPKYIPGKARLEWPEFGARAVLLSADAPNRFRGPQYDTFAADELAAWRYPGSWHNAMLGLRLGDSPKAVVATTPRPTPLIKQLISRDDVCITSGSTYDNKANLAADFIQQVRLQYEGTRLGRQEIHAEILDDNPRALWKRSDIDQARLEIKKRGLRRVVVAVDPAATSSEDSDETGIIVVGIDEHGEAFVLEDLSGKYSPHEWAKVVVRAYYKHKADRIVAEVNNGGEMVESTIRTVDQNVAYRAVRATKGKAVRAEPAAALYEQHRVHHCGFFPKLEDQLCEWDPSSGKSPDRLDALVWALTDLLLKPQISSDGTLFGFSTSER